MKKIKVAVNYCNIEFEVKGFYTKGGAYEVGTASTAAVTNSCIAILIADYLLAQLLVG